APLGRALAGATGAVTVVNIYGMEVWTDLRRGPAAALRRAAWIVSDCHNTARYAFEHGLCTPARTVVPWDCGDTVRFSPRGGDGGGGGWASATAYRPPEAASPWRPWAGWTRTRSTRATIASSTRSPASPRTSRCGSSSEATGRGGPISRRGRAPAGSRAGCS